MDEQVWSEWNYDVLEASGQFLDGPGWIKKLTLTSDDTNPASVAFYDGHTTNGKHRITLRVAKDQTHDVDYEIPFKVEQGLYAELSADIECVSVQYKKMKP